METGIEKIRQAFRKFREITIEAARKVNKAANESVRMAKEEKKKEAAFADIEQKAAVHHESLKRQEKEMGDGWLVCGVRGETQPAVFEIKICKDKKEMQRQKRKIYNEGNNKRKIKGKPMRRYIAKMKIKREKCPIRTQEIGSLKIFVKDKR